MPGFTILKSRTLPVVIQIDILDYFQSYLDFNENRESKELADQFNQHKLILNGLVNKELLWLEIKKELSSRLKCDANLVKIANTLDEKKESKLPLALRSLSTSFIELFKNSIDASLKTNLISGTKKSLQISIDMTVAGDQINIYINDNAGGFSADYLSNFNEYIYQKGYKYNLTSSNKLLSDKELFLGGAGKGMSIFLNLLLDGEAKDGKEGYLKIWEITRQASIKIENVAHDIGIGMEMTISSSLEPCKEYSNSFQEKLTTKRVEDSRFTRPRLPSLSFFKSKIREQSDDRKNTCSEQAFK